MSIQKHPGDALIEQREELEAKIRSTQFPELVEEEVTDDGETYMALRCPRCGLLVDDTNLAAVDEATRWTYSEGTDDDAFNHRRVTFFTDSTGDFGETIYYLHNDDHAVSLPDGWTENWS